MKILKKLLRRYLGIEDNLTELIEILHDHEDICLSLNAQIEELRTLAHTMQIYRGAPPPPPTAILLDPPSLLEE